MKKKKLELKKKVIASLSDAQKARIVGGEDYGTTSFSNCTNFICCNDACTQEATQCNNATCADTCPATCKNSCDCTLPIPGCSLLTCF